MIAIRLSRGGRVHHPVYTIIATDRRNPRDGRFLQKLGKYDPLATEADNQLREVKTEEIKELISKGAMLSDTVRTLFKKHKIVLS